MTVFRWTIIILASMAAFIFWGVSSVFAGVLGIANPDTIKIEDVRAYNTVLTDGDLLVLVEYNLVYASLPDEVISDAFVGRFKRGTEDLNQTEPFSFNDKGYGRGVFSLYWTPAEVTTSSIEFGNTNSEDYTVTLQGKLGVFPSTIPSITTSTIDWQNVDITRTLLHEEIVFLARKFENDPGWNDDADFDDLIVNPGGEDQLTTTGENYFQGAIAQLSLMVPALFTSGVTAPDFVESDFGTSYQDELDTFWDGNWVDTKFQTLADRYEVPKRALTSVFALFWMILIAWFVSRLLEGVGENQMFGIATMALTLPMFTAVNWIPLPIALSVAFLALLGVGWTLFLRRAGG